MGVQMYAHLNQLSLGKVGDGGQIWFLKLRFWRLTIKTGPRCQGLGFILFNKFLFNN